MPTRLLSSLAALALTYLFAAIPTAQAATVAVQATVPLQAGYVQALQAHSQLSFEQNSKGMRLHFQLRGAANHPQANQRLSLQLIARGEWTILSTDQNGDLSLALPTSSLLLISIDDLSFGEPFSLVTKLPIDRGPVPLHPMLSAAQNDLLEGVCLFKLSSSGILDLDQPIPAHDPEGAPLAPFALPASHARDGPVLADLSNSSRSWD